MLKISILYFQISLICAVHSKFQHVRYQTTILKVPYHNSVYLTVLLSQLRHLTTDSNLKMEEEIDKYFQVVLELTKNAGKVRNYCNYILLKLLHDFFSSLFQKECLPRKQ